MKNDHNYNCKSCGTYPEEIQKMVGRIKLLFDEEDFCVCCGAITLSEILGAALTSIEDDLEVQNKDRFPSKSHIGRLFVLGLCMHNIIFRRNIRSLARHKMSRN